MEKHVFAITMLFTLLLLLMGLLFSVLNDSYIEKDKRRIFISIVLLALSLVAQNYAGYLLDTDGIMPYARTLVGIYGYCVRPVILLMFCHIVGTGRTHRNAWFLVGLNAVVHLTACFSGICFSIDADNLFHRGPLGYTCHVVSGIMLFYLLWLTFRRYRVNIRQNLFIPVFNAAVIIFSVILDSFVDYREYPATFLTISVVVCCVFYYIWLHLQFVREHEKELRDGQRVQIMLSQIKPHFLYNSLGAIEELCESDPQAARAATITFSRYLRGNMTSISTVGSIPFEKELSHTKFYLELEQIRFEDALQVEYDISCTDFSIPTLTLEPLVENAVRHGVRGNEDGRGTVTVSTRELPDRFEVSVTDDGPGFDPEEKPDDGHPHVGLSNVRERLMQVCGGTLVIESSIGRGTTATIVLPKKRSGIEYERNV